PTAAPKRPAIATGIAVTTQGATTRVSIALTAAADVQIFTLADPHRLIIDATDLDFELPESLSRQSAGLVQALRFGLIAPGRSRIVVDLSGPASVTDNRAAVARAPGAAQLVLLLNPTSAANFTASVNRPPPLAPATPESTWQPSIKKSENSKPVIVIDPGHGGIDGGAVGANNVVEKELVLAVARQLRQHLQGAGRYDVRMTRTADNFISLDQRLQFSKTADAALFVSIHADSVADANVARTAHGATVYTLAETASNRAAQRLADKENAADARVGVVTDQASETAQISSILNDLLHRETQNFSMQFKKLIVDRLGRERLLARDPARAAAFKVLRQSNTPSVLIELGFITNAEEVQAMQTAAWQQKVAGALSTAIDAYFDSQKPK
ncbi:MAG: N-acetylmuramoyl-L-alanine amidase, partial [Hyphomicrobiaceae bacterium]|nr:N-acetylmuramoyl-L-alanine amidase [Hyphomicrobiaceae bacterium]